MELNSQIEEEFPDAEDFFLKLPILFQRKLKNEDAGKTLFLEFFDRTLDSFCIECGKTTVFLAETIFPTVVIKRNNHRSTNFQDWLNLIANNAVQLNLLDDPYNPTGYKPWDIIKLGLRNRAFTVSFKCPRDENHKLKFVFYVHDGFLEKIGQYPSLAALVEYEVKKYRKVLSDEKYRELTRAIGLTSHGVGIGAFVYLRRIFEDLIEEAHTEASAVSSWIEAVYIKSRMEEKIQLLSPHLPKFLVENKGIYGILSKGIHELSENICLKYFDVLRTSIELILDQKVEEQERSKKMKSVESEISKINTFLKT